MENNEKNICPLCGREFRTKQSLAMHLVACTAKKKIEQEKIPGSIDNNIIDNSNDSETIVDNTDNNSNDSETIVDNTDNNSNDSEIIIDNTDNNSNDSEIIIDNTDNNSIVEEPKNELQIKINELNLFLKSIKKSSVSPQEIDKMFDYYVWFTKKPKPNASCHQCVYDAYMCLMENIKINSHLINT